MIKNRTILPAAVKLYDVWWKKTPYGARRWFVTIASASIFLNFDINVFIISRENSCKIGRTSYVRCAARHRPMLFYTDADRRPYGMWPRKRKFLKIVRFSGEYQIRRWCANRWNRTMAVLFVRISITRVFVENLNTCMIKLSHKSIRKRRMCWNTWAIFNIKAFQRRHSV